MELLDQGLWTFLLLSGLQGDPTSPSWRKSVLDIHWKDWWWSWNSSTLVTSRKELTHLKRPWCCKRLRAGEDGADRGWDGWMPSPTQRTRVWVNSRRWWWTGRPGMLWSIGSQRVGHNWATELNWIFLEIWFAKSTYVGMLLLLLLLSHFSRYEMILIFHLAKIYPICHFFFSSVYILFVTGTL